MSERVSLISGLLPPTPDGIGIYSSRLVAEMASDVEIIHLPASRSFSYWYRAVRNSRSPILHVQYPSWGASWRQALVPFILRMAAPRSVVVTTFHEWAGMRRLMRWSALPLLFISRRLVVVSRTVEHQLLTSRLRRVRRTKIDYIPMTSLMEVPPRLDETVLERRRQKLLADGSNCVVTHFGFVYASKQPERLLEAVAQLNSTGGRCKLVFVGGFFQHRPEREQEFRERIHELGLGGAVEIMGYIEDPAISAEIIGASDAAIALYEDGASVRRTSLWYLCQLGVPIITTQPTLDDEFDGTSIDLAEDRFRVLARGAGASDLAGAIESLPSSGPRRWPALDPPSWPSIAAKHRQVYAEVANSR